MLRAPERSVVAERGRCLASAAEDVAAERGERIGLPATLSKLSYARAGRFCNLAPGGFGMKPRVPGGAPTRIPLPPTPACASEYASHVVAEPAGAAPWRGGIMGGAGIAM